MPEEVNNCLTCGYEKCKETRRKLGLGEAGDNIETIAGFTWRHICAQWRPCEKEKGESKVMIKNCGTCRYEPDWSRVHGQYQQLYCLFPWPDNLPDCYNVLPVNRFKKDDGYTYEAFSIIKNCPGHQPKAEVTP